MKNIIFAFFATFIFCISAVGFPEMVRHGYVNCTACHVSPSGGGVLTAYGRSLSAELMSTWASRNEEQFLGDALNTSKLNEWLALGGEYRGVQVHTDYLTDSNGQRTISGRWINMQIGLEVAILQPKWSLVAYLGQYNISDRENRNQVLLDPSRYYGIYKISDEMSFKLGRYQPIFGIHLPDHNLLIRTQTGVNPLSYRKGQIVLEDKYTAEFSWLTDSFNLNIAHYKIRPEISQGNETGFTASYSKIIDTNIKFGPQILLENSPQQNKSIIGLSGIFGWTSNLATIAEIDEISRTAKDTEKTVTGYAMFQRTAYEAVKGLSFAFLNDYSQLDRSVGSTKTYRLGPGILWLPRPHFDFQFFATQEYRDSLREPGTYSWLMTHYYF